MSLADVETNCTAIPECAGVYCYEGYDADKRCIARSAAELAGSSVGGTDTYNKLRPAPTMAPTNGTLVNPSSQ